MPTQRESAVTGDPITLEELLPALKDQTLRLARSTGDFTVGLAKIYRSLSPLIELINRKTEISESELGSALDEVFLALRDHPVTSQLRGLTDRMRSGNLLPNEQSTENLLRFLVDQITSRSVVPIPTEITDEFWTFFNELMTDPEVKGLGEVSLDVLRIFLNAYEPLLVQVINQLKDLRQVNDTHMRGILKNTRVIRDDLVIFRRQIGALRHVREFFATDPKDHTEQAEVIAQMVREFGPFFIKMAQVAAASSDFLPDEINEALAVFQEDVEPMSAADVEQAFLECYGELPHRRYFNFDAHKPLKSGSIASVYLAQKPHTNKQGEKVLTPVVVKVGRHNLEREFLIGKTVIKLAILSSHYWAPHSKLSPFFSSWLGQVDVFVDGFREELDFEAEAANQARFAQRASATDTWHVPVVYNATRRIIEMEFIDSSASLNSAFPKKVGHRDKRARRKLGRKFLHTVISHMFVYREFHGDLHPGNVLVAKQTQLHFIDWGNTIDLEPIWVPSLKYLQAVLGGDAQAISSAIIELGAEPEAVTESREELENLIAKTMADAGVTPLGYDFALILYHEGQEGLLKRLELAINLATAISRQGIVIRAEYLHLTRSLTAMIGSYLGIYRGLPRRMLYQDIAQVLIQFPTREGLHLLSRYRRAVLNKIIPNSPLNVLSLRPAKPLSQSTLQTS
ncbi:MAG: AarF/ABC1/UbiB kinase family protein [Proteobacteria bacterium]|nr:AarF/ABC1/UbiB kinase family protein [Pseudomonadota bacterium]